MFCGVSHIPVLLHEVVDALNLRDGGVYVDGTFGRGGYTKKILQSRLSVQVIGIDRDPSAKTMADELLSEYPDRFRFIQGVFSQTRQHLQAINIEKVDGVVLDLGVSSPQLDDAERGFSFQQNGPLDMRMSQDGISAADIVNTWSETDLANMIYRFGDERKSRKVAKAIVQKRQQKLFETTFELADVVRSAVPRDRASKIDGATRTFQAIRIAVNGELDELSQFLETAPQLLKEGGRLGIVSFHSLEDGCVKRQFREWCEPMHNTSRHLPNVNPHPALFNYISRKGITPTEEEIQNNPRSRSARLRVIERQ